MIETCVSRAPCLRRQIVRLFALVVLSLPALAHAFVHRVAPGELPRVGRDEALLVVSVDTSVALASLRVQRVDAMFSAATVRSIPAGVSAHLYVVPVGDYRWQLVRSTPTTAFDLADDPEFRFRVRAGVVNYAGDLIFRAESGAQAFVHVSNRGLRMIDWLGTTHPAIYRAYAFDYSGHYDDPFPAFYREATLQAAAGYVDATLAPPDPGELPLPVELLARRERVGAVALSPDGRIIAKGVREFGREWIDLVAFDDATDVRRLASDSPISALAWAGPRSLVVSAGNGEDGAQVSIVRLGARDAVERWTLPRRGVVVDVLPEQSDRLLFASLGSDGRWAVHKLDISGRRAIEQFDFAASARVNGGAADDYAWFVDGAGRIRAAMTRGDAGTQMLYRRTDAFEPVLRTAESAFEPFGVSADGGLVYGVTDAGRSQRDLVAFDPIERKVVRTLFSLPGVDITRPLFGAGREPIGASYLRDGQPVSHYFATTDQRVDALLRQAFPDMAVTPLSLDAGARRWIVRVEAGNRPPALYSIDAATGRILRIEELLPWLYERRYAATSVIHTRGRDGLALEAYLTLPSSNGRRAPVVVMPHGGPIGARDQVRFDEDVQFVASLGYAVLQVNYRGSDGYGKAFREAGAGQFGRSIEDDIGAALDAALASHPLDKDRVCALGASYGGYSALVTSFRWPGKLRCVVSIAGLTDNELFLTSSDAGRTIEGRRELERVVGDPVTEAVAMRQSSPLYRYLELGAPIMLVQGGEDMRVDAEHARRLVRMLNIAGKPPVMLEFEREGHGIVEPRHRREMWHGIAGFLRSHLDAAPTATAGTVKLAGDPTVPVSH